MVTLMPALIQPRALIVDDCHDKADTLGRLMTICGADVRVAYDGHAALQIATTFLPHLAMLDLVMPDFDGLSLGRKFREVESLRDMQLVAVSGYADGDHQKLAHEAGFDQYIIKPFSLDQVQAILTGVRQRVSESQKIRKRSQQLQDSTQRNLAGLDELVEQSLDVRARSAEVLNRRVSHGATYFASLDSAGVIKVVSRAWRATYKNPWVGVGFGVGSNYLMACQTNGHPTGRQIATAIQEVLTGRQADVKIDLAFDGRSFTFQAVADRGGAFIVFKDRTPR
jgi:DNA-binding response OmpR family regulator